MTRLPKSPGSASPAQLQRWYHELVDLMQNSTGSARSSAANRPLPFAQTNGWFRQLKSFRRAHYSIEPAASEPVRRSRPAEPQPVRELFDFSSLQDPPSTTQPAEASRAPPGPPPPSREALKAAAHTACLPDRPLVILGSDEADLRRLILGVPTSNTRTVWAVDASDEIELLDAPDLARFLAARHIEYQPRSALCGPTPDADVPRTCVLTLQLFENWPLAIPRRFDEYRVLGVAAVERGYLWNTPEGPVLLDASTVTPPGVVCPVSAFTRPEAASEEARALREENATLRRRYAALEEAYALQREVAAGNGYPVVSAACAAGRFVFSALLGRWMLWLVWFSLMLVLWGNGVFVPPGARSEGTHCHYSTDQPPGLVSFEQLASELSTSAPSHCRSILDFCLAQPTDYFSVFFVGLTSLGVLLAIRTLIAWVMPTDLVQSSTGPVERGKASYGDFSPALQRAVDVAALAVINAPTVQSAEAEVAACLRSLCRTDSAMTSLGLMSDALCYRVQELGQELADTVPAVVEAYSQARGLRVWGIAAALKRAAAWVSLIPSARGTPVGAAWMSSVCGGGTTSA